MWGCDQKGRSFNLRFSWILYQSVWGLYDKTRIWALGISEVVSAFQCKTYFPPDLCGFKFSHWNHGLLTPGGLSIQQNQSGAQWGWWCHLAPTFWRKKWGVVLSGFLEISQVLTKTDKAWQCKMITCTVDTCAYSWYLQSNFPCSLSLFQVRGQSVVLDCHSL